jgi:hypothetical protein
MQCDDLLSANYYEELVQCLETSPRATNCYPEVVTMVNKRSSENISMHSTLGPIHERVEKVVAQASWIPNRGVVRRLLQRSGFGTGFLYPRLHQSFTEMDFVYVLKHAIAGELIGCSQVSYFKIIHAKQISTQHYNQKVFDTENLMIGIADRYAQQYNLTCNPTSVRKVRGQAWKDI